MASQKEGPVQILSLSSAESRPCGGCGDIKRTVRRKRQLSPVRQGDAEQRCKESEDAVMRGLGGELVRMVHMGVLSAVTLWR